MPLGDNNSYTAAILDTEQTCNAHTFSVVVKERQLRHANLHTGRIEANLEAFFTAKDLEVQLMPADRKHAFHGLQLPSASKQRSPKPHDIFRQQRGGSPPEGAGQGAKTG